jgi:hypothetical protein
MREVMTIVILSPRDEFLTQANLARLNDVVGFDDTFSPRMREKFGKLSAAICPLGDIVVKTVGAFDDKDGRSTSSTLKPRSRGLNWRGCSISTTSELVEHRGDGVLLVRDVIVSGGDVLDRYLVCEKCGARNVLTMRVKRS